MPVVIQTFNDGESGAVVRNKINTSISNLKDAYDDLEQSIEEITNNPKVITALSKLNFPTVGNVDTLYVAQDEDATYRWNDNPAMYYCVGRNYENIDTINGGGSN